MKQKRVISLIIAIMMLATIFIPAAYAQTKPSVSVVGTVVEDAEGNIDNTYFEVSMKVESGDEGFFSAGMVLQYDMSKLKLVDWNGNEIDLSQSTDWIKAMPVPAIGPKELTGKYALAYQSTVHMGETEKNIGYLSLTAEASRTMILKDDTQNVVNVRFKYADETAKSEMINDLNSDGADFAMEKFIGLAPDDVAAESVVNQSVWYQANDETTIYYYTTNDETLGVAYGTVMDKPSFVLRKGATVNSGGGGMTLDQVGVVMFYDWQEDFMGARAMSSTTGEEELQTITDEFAKLSYSGNYTTDTNTNESRYVADDTKVLTNKKGYNFGGWVQVTPATLESTFTAYDTKEEIDNAIVDIQNDGLAMSGGVAYLKAAYVGNEELNKFDGSGGTVIGSSKYYTYSDFTYGKAGDNTYIIEFTVNRENPDKYGVTKLKNPVVKLEASLGGSSVYVSSQMTGDDIQRVQVAIPKPLEKEMDYAKISVADNSTNEYITIAPSSENGIFNPYSEGSIINSGAGYVVEGTVIETNSIIAEAIEQFVMGKAFMQWTMSFSYMSFDEMKLCEDYIDKQIGIGSTSSSTLTNAAKNKIMLYKVAKNGKNLTLSDMQNAILMETERKAGTTATWSTMQSKIEAVQNHVDKIGCDMTIEELEDFINLTF